MWRHGQTDGYHAIMKTLTSLILLALLCGSGAALAQDAASLKAQMAPQTFKAAGLDTLSPRQLATLEHWLRNHPQAMQPDQNAPPPAARMGARDLQKPRHHRASEPDRITSTVVGTFSGWRHGSVITLANGQKWQVVGDSDFYIPRTPHIKATIKHGFMGGYLLTVHGYNTSARVKRIQ